MAVLQARPGVTARELADRFATTDRTIRRDIAGLRELGYRIDAAPGRAGGYTLGTGSARPPLVLDDAEAVAVALGLRMVAEAGVRDVDAAAVTAIAKLEQLLPSRVRTRWVAIAAATSSSAGRRAALVDADVLATCAVACRSREGLRIRHGRATAAPRGRERTASPAGPPRRPLVPARLRGGGGRLAGLPAGPHLDARPLAVRLPTPAPPSDPVGFVSERVAAGGWPVLAVVRLPMDHVSAATVVPSTLGTLLADGRDATLLRIGGDDLGWVARQLARLECDFDVVSPPGLSAALHDLAPCSPSASARQPTSRRERRTATTPLAADDRPPAGRRPVVARDGCAQRHRSSSEHRIVQRVPPGRCAQGRRMMGTPRWPG